ncbi:MAG: tetratricopeptide repeat protein [Tateyamaria sp.]|uniref:tetratricopeptide repeat protein n=1 Tax=Alphaproteobacteria TaxID=28211 RepID=UPI00326344B9
MKQVLGATALAVLLAVGGQAVSAQDYDKGWAAYESGDFETALQEFRPLAEQGNADAQLRLGRMHDKGEGVTQHHVEAVKWYRLSAEQGEKFALYYLADAYRDGRGVIQDNLYAHMWFNIGASLGFKLAALNRDEMAKEMTAEDISKAQTLARECVAKDYKGC